MAISYLSFGSFAKLHNNALNTTASIGELSTKARTYAKDPGVFSINTAVSECVLVNFSSLNNTTEFVMSQATAEVQIGIGNWLYTQAKAGNINNSRPNTLVLLKAQFTNNIEITDCGEMVTNNSIWFPSFVTGNHIVSGVKQAFYIWFADEYFKSQYPKVSYTIVHPIPLTEIDSLMTSNYLQIAERFKKETQDVLENRVKAITTNNAWPYTARDVDKFNIVDLVNKPNVNIGYWTYLAWGNGKDSEDQRLEQIKAEILAASKFPLARWEEKIPDLFNPLEFYVLPYYTRKGLINQTNGASALSPIGDRETMMALVDYYLTPNMTADHVIKSMQTVPFLYKSTLCAFVGKVANRADRKKISSVVPDYSLIPSADSDFELMAASTTDFIRHMEDLLAAAEVTTPYTLLPDGITRVTRFNKLCVARRSGNVKYIVITRWQYVQDGRITD